MTEENKQPDAASTTPDKDVGAAEGGADAGGSGNILAGVQPSTEKDRDTERRHD